MQAEQGLKLDCKKPYCRIKSKDANKVKTIAYGYNTAYSQCQKPQF